MRHLAADDIGVSGEDAVGFGRDHDAVRDAWVVVAIFQLVSISNVVLYRHLHKNWQRALVCNDRIPLPDALLACYWAKITWRKHETPLSARLLEVFQPFQRLINAVDQCTRHDGIVWEAGVRQSFAHARDNIDAFLSRHVNSFAGRAEQDQTSYAILREEYGVLNLGVYIYFGLEGGG